MGQNSEVTKHRGLWVYAICRDAIDESILRSLTGVGGAAVMAVTASGLTAVAEGVGLGEFGEQALRTHLEDMDWLETTARAHHGVIDGVARHAPVVPMRLATVYSSEAAVREMLSARSAEISDVLGRIAARSEWGVKAYAAAASGGDAEARDPRQAGRAPGSGAAYLRRRREELSAQQHGRRQAIADAERVHEGLARIADAARLHAPQAPQLTGTQEPMVLNAAYLMDERRPDAIPQAMAGLAEQCRAVRLELTGPWPPYSFAEMQGEVKR